MGSSWADSLGVALMASGSPAGVAAWALAAEGAGLGSAWLIEDYFHPGAFAQAGAVAAMTERIAIGLGVVNPYTRHPALLAMEVAALAAMAPGRVVLGLGSSNRRWIEDQMGIPFKTPLADLAESVAVVRRLLRGERVTTHGGRFDLERVELEWAPAGELPLLLGVKGPRALRLAAEIADGVLCSVLTSPAHVRRVRESDANGAGILRRGGVRADAGGRRRGAGARGGSSRSSAATSARSTANRSSPTPGSHASALSRSATPCSRERTPATWSPTRCSTPSPSRARRSSAAACSPVWPRPGSEPPSP